MRDFFAAIGRALRGQGFNKLEDVVGPDARNTIGDIKPKNSTADSGDAGHVDVKQADLTSFCTERFVKNLFWNHETCKCEAAADVLCCLMKLSFNNALNGGQL